MSTPNRTARIAHVLKILKRHYKPATPPGDRPVLDHLLYACCLENAKYEQADEAFARLQQEYFDWNEVRVSTVAELSETMAALPDAAEAASRLRRTLQSVFEAYYAFDLEFLRKQNLGQAAKELQRHDGITPYALAYVTQQALGGHAIPVNRGVLDALTVLGVLSEQEAQQGRVPGLERAVPKRKGAEAAALLQQFGADFYAAPHGSRIRSILLEIEPECKPRLPKRRSRKAPQTAEPAPNKPQADQAKAESGAGSARRQPAPPEQAGGGKREAAKRRRSGASGESTAKGSAKQLTRKKPR